MESQKMHVDLLVVLILAVAAGLLVIPDFLKVGWFSENVSPSPTEAVQKDLAEKSKGRVLYDVPSNMIEGKEITVPVRISANMVEDLKKGLPQAKEATTEAIDAYTLMGVRLQGDEGFKIVPPPEQDQFISSDRFSEWKYRVTPIASGEHFLTLLVGVRVMLPGGHEESRFDPILERKVAVKVNVRYAILQFLGNHIELFISGLVFGPIGFFLSRWIERRGKSKTGHNKGHKKEPKDKAVDSPAPA